MCSVFMGCVVEFSDVMILVAVIHRVNPTLVVAAAVMLTQRLVRLGLLFQSGLVKLDGAVESLHVGKLGGQIVLINRRKIGV